MDEQQHEQMDDGMGQDDGQMYNRGPDEDQQYAQQDMEVSYQTPLLTKFRILSKTKCNNNK